MKATCFLRLGIASSDLDYYCFQSILALASPLPSLCDPPARLQLLYMALHTNVNPIKEAIA